MSTSRDRALAMQSRKLPQKDKQVIIDSISTIKGKNGDHLFKQIKQSLQSRENRARSLLRDSNSNSNMRGSVAESQQNQHRYQQEPQASTAIGQAANFFKRRGSQIVQGNLVDGQ